MNRRRSGFTLIEVIIAGGLTAAILLFSLRLVSHFSNTLAENQTVLDSESDFIEIERDLRWYFGRAVGVAVTQLGPGVANFAVARNGAVVLYSDLRPCETFSPLTAALPVNRTVIRISCCGANQNVVANLPFGGVANVASQCRIRNGLSVEVVRGATTELSRCYPSISDLDVATSGFNDITQSTIFFWNISTPSGLAVGGNRAIAELRTRLQLYLSPGLQGAQESVVCQYPVGLGI